MNIEWEGFIEQCTEKGYRPHDVERMIYLYEMFKEQDEVLKEQLWQEENEEAPF